MKKGKLCIHRAIKVFSMSMRRPKSQNEKKMFKEVTTISEFENMLQLQLLLVQEIMMHPMAYMYMDEM
jgi:hypothetical protein